ncbi:MAG: hypothetical protein J6A48_08255, partial [Clostridia bacterium]|nr:hypothetical protein [Clostridia bacterium]
MMKKLIALLMCLCMLLGLASCQKTEEVAEVLPTVAPTEVVSEETAPAAEETTDEAAAPAEEAAATEEVPAAD